MSKELFQQTEVSGSAYSCLTNFEVAHYRASEGYKNNFYDIMGDDGTKKQYYTTMPASDGDLYFTGTADRSADQGITKQKTPENSGVFKYLKLICLISSQNLKGPVHQ